MPRPYISQQSINRAELLVRTMRENKISLDPKGFEFMGQLVLTGVLNFNYLGE